MVRQLSIVSFLRNFALCLPPLSLKSPFPFFSFMTGNLMKHLDLSWRDGGRGPIRSWKGNEDSRGREGGCAGFLPDLLREITRFEWKYLLASFLIRSGQVKTSVWQSKSNPLSRTVFEQFLHICSILPFNFSSHGYSFGIGALQLSSICQKDSQSSVP